jgi:peptide/nickel transport system permease protein
MIILWTDALIFFLIVLAIISALSIIGKPQWQRPLMKISHSVSGMMSLLILLFFISIGLLDSIHFKAVNQNRSEVISLLDDWLTPIRNHSEKTYSAPFATQLYSKEMQIIQGHAYWLYPRLHYGGAHLQHPDSEYIFDIMSKSLLGFLQGAGIFASILGLINLFLRKYNHGNLFRQSSPLNTSFKAVLWLGFFLCSGSVMLFKLAHFYHILGTDKVGEDVFYQAIKSIRTGLVIGSLTTLIMLPLAIIFGILAGFFQAWVDDLIQYLYTTLNAIPSVLLIAASVLMVQVYMANHPEAFTNTLVRADSRLLALCLILGMTSWTGLCRLLRAETLKLREMDYVQAARSLGVKPSRILLRHILPNLMHLVLISVVLDFSSLVLAEAVLSYINIGVDPSTYSWGNMINGARLEMAREPIVWWSLTAAFVFMFSLVLAANLFADCVSEAFDPRRIDD